MDTKLTRGGARKQGQSLLLRDPRPLRLPPHLHLLRRLRPLPRRLRPLLALRQLPRQRAMSHRLDFSDCRRGANDVRTSFVCLLAGSG